MTPASGHCGSREASVRIAHREFEEKKTHRRPETFAKLRGKSEESNLLSKYENSRSPNSVTPNSNYPRSMGAKGPQLTSPQVSTLFTDTASPEYLLPLCHSTFSYSPLPRAHVCYMFSPFSRSLSPIDRITSLACDLLQQRCSFFLFFLYGSYYHFADEGMY